MAKDLRHPHDSVIGVSVPKALRDVLRRLPKWQCCDATSVSAWIRKAISQRLERETIPTLLDYAKRSTSAQQLGTLALIGRIRAALVGITPAGRLRNRRVRCFYMRYCNDCKRNGTHRLPYAKWRATIDEITLTDPAGFNIPAANRAINHSAPIPAAKDHSAPEVPNI